MLRLFLSFSIFGALLGGCTTAPERRDEPPVSEKKDILDSVVAFHGGALYDNAIISFGFREKDFSIESKGDAYNFTSTFRDSTGRHERNLTNLGFTEKLNGRTVKLSAIDSAAHSATLNSVVYFAMLPYALLDDAVRFDEKGVDIIKGKEYRKLEVTFSEAGGGNDFDDVYYYWIDAEDYSMDYLAYSFREKDTGTRFRKAFNQRKINGLMFQDYENYKGPGDPDSLKFILDFYKAGQLELLSTIVLDRIRVQGAPGK